MLELTTNTLEPASIQPCVLVVVLSAWVTVTVTLVVVVAAPVPRLTSCPCAKLVVVSVAPPAPAPITSIVFPIEKPEMEFTTSKSEPAAMVPAVWAV